jgi:hypothetical protein
MLMDVDFHAFERLVIFARGDTSEKRTLRRLQNWFRKQEIEVPIYQRLVMMLKLRQHQRLGRFVDQDKIYLQIFKNIPQQDISMLLPGARMRMKVVDRGKIGLPLISGCLIALWQMLRDVVEFFSQYVVQLLTFQPEALWVIATGSVGYSMRTYYGYVQTKQKYNLRLTEILYFQNLDTNAGVLYRVLDEAEEQQCRELLLAYFFLWRHGGAEGWTGVELDHAIAAYLAHQAQIRLQCRVRDTLVHLERLQVVEQQNGRYRARPLPEALALLDWTWDNYFKYNGSVPERPAAVKQPY